MPRYRLTPSPAVRHGVLVFLLRKFLLTTISHFARICARKASLPSRLKCDVGFLRSFGARAALQLASRRIVAEQHAYAHDVLSTRSCAADATPPPAQPSLRDARPEHFA